MLNLIKPNKLNPGDKVATVSLSWGGAGDEVFRWRYEQGKQRLENIYGLQVVEMQNTLAGSQFLYEHPEKRAEDLMQAFSDKSVKAIINCVGGEDSVRIIPFVDYNLIKGNPKIFTGYSDTTVGHFICMKAGISSFYGASLMNDFAENVNIPDYTDTYIRKTMFSDEIVGEIPCSTFYTSEYLEWSENNSNTARHYKRNSGYEILQGEGVATGRLIGGCLEIMDLLKGTQIFPTNDCFDNSILFVETSEEQPSVFTVTSFFRSLGAMGILRRLKGIAVGRPYDNMFYDEYKQAIKTVLFENNLEKLPVIYNCSFGHNEPRCIIPMGANAEIDCDKNTFSILESASK